MRLELGLHPPMQNTKRIHYVHCYPIVSIILRLKNQNCPEAWSSSWSLHNFKSTCNLWMLIQSFTQWSKMKSHLELGGIGIRPLTFWKWCNYIIHFLLQTIYYPVHIGTLTTYILVIQPPVSHLSWEANTGRKNAAWVWPLTPRYMYHHLHVDTIRPAQGSTLVRAPLPRASRIDR